MKKNRTYFIAGTVAAITLLVYLPALRNGFVEWDDNEYIFENPYIRSLDISFFKWAFSGFWSNNWHPVTWISHALDYSAWGLNPAGHHLTSIILHAVNSFLVVALIMKLTNGASSTGDTIERRASLTAAAVTGLLFGLHPLHVESVVWVSERKDLLCALFFLLSIIVYLGYAREAAMHADDQRKVSLLRDRRYLGSLGLFSLALLSKPMAVTLPGVLLILDWHPLERIRSFRTLRSAAAEKVPFLVLVVASSAMTILAQKAGGAVRSTDFAPVSTRLLVAAQSLVGYTGKMLWPLNLVPCYPYPSAVSAASPGYLLPVVLVLGAIAACVALARRYPGWTAAWGYYLITLAPVLGIVQVGAQAMADRYTYLPSLGPFFLAGAGAARVFQQAGPVLRRAAGAAGLLLLAGLSALTINQTGIWRDSFTLWDCVIEHQPDFSIAYLNRGVAYEQAGRFEFAIRDYNRAIELNPGDFKGYFNRGVAFHKLGQSDSAIENFNYAIAMEPNNTQMLVARGLVYLKLSRPDLSVFDFKRACDLGDGTGCRALRMPGMNRSGIP